MTAGSILVIEDNLDNLELVSFLLERGGFQTIKATDGRSGLELARSQQPDLILMDLTIPEIDGWHLAQQLKKDATTTIIPLLAMTAHILPGDRKKALDSGCDGYITKPLDIPNFIPTIEKYIRRQA
ncbi:MAG TPA: response regulator [Anaerolineaceae bacterium]|nr:response regulator [Anaerolineaceae bacterium]